MLTIIGNRYVLNKTRNKCFAGSVSLLCKQKRTIRNIERVGCAVSNKKARETITEVVVDLLLNANVTVIHQGHTGVWSSIIHFVSHEQSDEIYKWISRKGFNLWIIYFLVGHETSLLLTLTQVVIKRQLIVD